MTGLALLAQEVGVHERTLRRAVAQGTVRAARPSPRTLKLSLSERQYVRRSWRLLSALREALRTEQNVRFALLFGSTATGTATATSDIDVLIDLRDPSLERLLDLGAKLAVTAGRQVELVRLQDVEAEPLFLAAIVAEGRVLVDRERLWPKLRRRQPALQRRGRQRQTERTQAALAGIDRLLAVGRIQNFVAELANAGVSLAELPRPPIREDGSPAQQNFEALRDAGVIDGALCRRLIRAQKARTRIEHSYLQASAGDVHRAAKLIHQAARDFIGPYRDWIEGHLDTA